MKLVCLFAVEQDQLVPLANCCAFQAVFEFLCYRFLVLGISHAAAHGANVKTQQIALRTLKRCSWRVNVCPCFGRNQTRQQQPEDNIVQDVFETSVEFPLSHQTMLANALGERRVIASFSTQWLGNPVNNWTCAVFLPRLQLLSGIFSFGHLKDTIHNTSIFFVCALAEIIQSCHHHRNPFVLAPCLFV